MKTMIGVRLFADEAVRLLPIQEGPEAKWSLIFPRGEWFGENLRSIGGSIQLDDSLFAEMIQNWKDAGRPSLPVFYGHPDSDPTPGVTKAEKRKAAGWFEDLRVTPYGLEALVKWTDSAKEQIRADEYRYFSPEWTPQHLDRRTGEVKGWWLYGAALLNDPFFNSLPKVAASESPTAAGSDSASTTQGRRAQGANMDKKRLCAALGMPESCTDEELMAAIEAKCHATVNAAAEESKLTAAAIKEAVEPLKAALAAHAEQVKVLEAANAKLVADRFEADSKALCDELVKAGQVLPAHREKVVAFAKKTSLAEAREVYGALPRVAPPTGELGLSGAPDGGNDLVSLKAEYEKALDAASKSGESTILASRRLSRDEKFKPLMAANARSLTNKELEN